MAKIMTRWETFSYDVLGNKHDGYEVNNTYRGEEVDLALELKGYNQGTPHGPLNPLILGGFETLAPPKVGGLEGQIILALSNAENEVVLH